MDITKRFLQQDLHIVIAETFCASSLNETVKEEMLKGDFKGARVAAEDLVKSLKELERLQDKKRHRDGLERLANDLGIEKIEKIRKWS